MRGLSLGKVRPERVKKIARELMRRFPDKFTADFEKNKMVLSSIMQISSVSLRNRIAGYITRLVDIAQAAKAEQVEQAGEGGEETEEEEETEKG